MFIVLDISFHYTILITNVHTANASMLNVITLKLKNMLFIVIFTNFIIIYGFILFIILNYT